MKLAPLTPIVLMLIGLVLIFYNGEASGQGPGHNDDRLRHDLERTDRMIEQEN
jgi:hypothetical protein